ncbi:MAG TPA: polyketide cyclase / dehydrase and lipid transport family protein [Acidimicrobiia bacterium]|nr:polyketide cyclase / dehydrase and lipid transport family protein [Acidimicrobiia bacterium]
MQRHEFSVDLDAAPADVWEVFWYRAPDRPQPRDVDTRIDILHPGDEDGNGLVRHCTFPVPKWLLSKGVGQSWEWLTEVKPYESWRYDAIGKPLWSRARGFTRLEDLGDGRTRVHFSEEYEAFNPIMRALFEKRVHAFLSRDNDTILAALQGGIRWHQKRRRREASAG